MMDVEDRRRIYHLHPTMLHLLGVDQLKLTYFYSGRARVLRPLLLLAIAACALPAFQSAGDHFRLATSYAHQQRFRESAAEYREVLRLDPSNDLARLSLVKALIYLQGYPEALPLIEDYFSRHSDEFEANAILGAVYKGTARYPLAVPPLERAVRMQPGDFAVQYNLAFALARTGKAEQALAHLEKARDLNPESAEVHFQLAGVLRTLKQDGRAREELQAFQNLKQAGMQQNASDTKASRANQYLEAGDPRKAVQLYEEALRENPGNARTWYDLALARARLADRPGERQALEKAVALDSRFAPAHNQLGLRDLEDGSVAEAEKHLRTALTLNPQYAEAQSNLGVLYGQQGRNAEAEKLFREAVRNNPRYGQAFVNLAMVVAAQSRFPEAEQAAREGVRLEPDNASALTALGMLQTRLGKSQKAVENFRKVIALDPRSPEAHLNLGIALADYYDLEGALAEFSETVRLAPQAPAGHYNKGRALLDLRRQEEARAELEAAARLAPDNAAALYLLGLAEKQMDHPQRSAEFLRKAVTIDPRHKDAQYLLGQDLARLGKPAEAVEYWKKAVELQPEHGEALYNLARALRETDPAGSRQYQERFRELQKKRRITDRAETLNNFALASAAARDIPQAVAQLKEALEVCGDCRSRADLHKNLGLIYCRSGELKNGRAELLESRKLKPGDPDVARALDTLDSLER
jgi:tetratricopeptide (TPR) repeat protein